ncbi:MAG: tagatose-6-phosphate ketose isomerase [Silvibacterium sp.]
MNPLSALLSLSDYEKLERGLVHTPQEIMQQPATWLGTFGRLRPQLQEVRDFLTASGLQNPEVQRPIVFLVGAGTSDYIGQSLHHLLRKNWQCEVIPVSSPDLLMDFSDYMLPQRQYLWISFSRSGDSPEGVAVLARALAECPNVRHLVVSCNVSGQMIRSIQGQPNCLGIVLDEVTNDRGLAMTSSFSNMVLAGQILAHAWSIEEYEPICQALSQAAESFLPRAAGLAADLAGHGYTRACFVGSGVLTGAAMESALKLLELTAGNVQAFSQSTLALRHGPMAALDHGTLFVGLLSSQEQRRQYELDLLREIGGKSLVRSRIAVATSGIASLRPEADYVLTPERSFAIPDLYRPVLDVIFGQLLGLFASLHFGLKPDSPSPSGAISRVVQNVGIYQ